MAAIGVLPLSLSPPSPFFNKNHHHDFRCVIIRLCPSPCLLCLLPIVSPVSREFYSLSLSLLVFRIRSPCPSSLLITSSRAAKKPRRPRITTNAKLFMGKMARVMNPGEHRLAIQSQMVMEVINASPVAARGPLYFGLRRAAANSRNY